MRVRPGTSVWAVLIAGVLGMAALSLAAQAFLRAGGAGPLVDMAERLRSDVQGVDFAAVRAVGLDAPPADNGTDAPRPAPNPADVVLSEALPHEHWAQEPWADAAERCRDRDGGAWLLRITLEGPGCRDADYRVSIGEYAWQNWQGSVNGLAVVIVEWRPPAGSDPGEEVEPVVVRAPASIRDRRRAGGSEGR